MKQERSRVSLGMFDSLQGLSRAFGEDRTFETRSRFGNKQFDLYITLYVLILLSYQTLLLRPILEEPHGGDAICIWWVTLES